MQQQLTVRSQVEEDQPASLITSGAEDAPQENRRSFQTSLHLTVRETIPEDAAHRWRQKYEHNSIQQYTMAIKPGQLSSLVIFQKKNYKLKRYSKANYLHPLKRVNQYAINIQVDVSHLSLHQTAS
jgi:hypothetical protein